MVYCGKPSKVRVYRHRAPPFRAPRYLRTRANKPQACHICREKKTRVCTKVTITMHTQHAMHNLGLLHTSHYLLGHFEPVQTFSNTYSATPVPEAAANVPRSAENAPAIEIRSIWSFGMRAARLSGRPRPKRLGSWPGHRQYVPATR